LNSGADVSGEAGAVHILRSKSIEQGSQSADDQAEARRRLADLVTRWTDPDFAPKLKAVYYVRVPEIPTPRWVAYDAVRYKLTLPRNVTMNHQERAFTSPIWYSPA